MISKLGVSVFLMLISANILAEMDYLAIAMEAKNRQSERIAEMQQEHGNSLLKAQTKTPAIMVFVSFSMPEKSIEAYLRDAKELNASIVIRGLIENSFQRTFQRIAQLVTASGGNGIELNPILFKKFGIQQVPSIVVLPENSTCRTKETCEKQTEFDVIKGDMSLYEALRQIRDKGGVASKTASLALSRD